MGPRGIGVRAAALFPLAGLYACPPSKPNVAEIELVPSKVAVAADPGLPTTFRLEARLWSGPSDDRETIPESAQVPLTWTVNPSGAGLDFQSSPVGYFASLVLKPAAAPTAPIEVKVEAGGLSATTQVIPSSMSGDVPITADYGGDMAPLALIVRGIRTPTDMPCAVWLAPGLVRRGLAGPVTGRCGGTDPPWGVALLDQGHGMQMFPAPWPSSMSATTTSPIRVLPLAMRVFITGGNLSTRQTDALGYGKQDIEDANQMFKDNRVGIQLNLVDYRTITPPLGVVETDILDCATGDKMTAGYDHVPSTDTILHVYIVDGLHIVDGKTTMDGFTCVGIDGRPQPVIYLAVDRSGTILLHELGHALGLEVPGTGHTDDMEGFDAADVMASGYADSDNIWRRRFTVGQVLRMNADSGSWLSRARDMAGALVRPIAEPRLACQCGYEDPAGRCPPLKEDIARPRGGVRHLESWACSDQIWMDVTETGEDPRALIAGRRWRSAVDDCPHFFPGYPLPHDGRTYIELENLTRPGGCPSWAAIFFKSHRPIFRSDAALETPWSDGADIRNARHTLNEMATVSVRVWTNATDAELAAAQAEAENIYGQGNRGGISFDWHPDHPLPTSCPADPPGPPVEYQVCYSSSGPSVAQLLGRKWGLHTLSTDEQLMPAYAKNAMLPSAPGTKLTLGQLFWVHVALKTADFPDCSTTPSRCPPQDADAVP